MRIPRSRLSSLVSSPSVKMGLVIVTVLEFVILCVPVTVILGTDKVPVLGLYLRLVFNLAD